MFSGQKPTLREVGYGKMLRHPDQKHELLF